MKYILTGFSLVFTLLLSAQTIFMDYPMDGNADDISGNNYNGTVYGPTLTTDRFGTSDAAYSFDGVNDYIDVGMIAPMNNILDNFTVSFWMKSDSNGVSTYFEAFGNINDPGAGLAFAIDIHRTVFTTFQKNSILFYLRDNSTKTMALTFTEPALFDNTWHCIAVKVNNSATGDVEVYIDGVIHTHTLDFNQAPSFTGTDFQYPFLIGALNNRGIIERFFKGSLDQFRIYDYAVNANILADCSAKIGIDEESSQFITGVKLYPNPAVDLLYIENTNPHLSQMTVYDMHGKLMVKSSIQNLDISKWSEGMYLVVFENENQTMKRQHKFIKD
jgi:hypothetical protein